MSEIAISVRGISKCYRVFDDQRSRVMHAIWPRYTRGMQDVWALKEVTFEVKRGEAVAIIGRNGGGKSTLLEILTGTLAPTSGQVTVNGRVSALLELGSGFNPEYSGRDNVVLNALLLGVSKSEIMRRFAEIEAFAEIGAAIDRPVKTYSSGMVMRLAFAVQVLCDPDILIIDEALSVGDFFFQQKCLSHIRGLCAKGMTLLFVSHDMGTVRDICKRAVYLKGGVVQLADETTKVIHRFLTDGKTVDSDHAGEAPARPTPSAEGLDENIRRALDNALWRSTEHKDGAAIQAVAMFDDDYVPRTTFTVGDAVRIVVVYEPGTDPDAHVSLAILNKFDQTVTVTGSYHLKCRPSEPQASHRLVAFETRIVMNLESGQYALSINLGKIVAENQGYALHQLPKIGPITLTWDYGRDSANFLGMCGLPASGSFHYATTGQV